MPEIGTSGSMSEDEKRSDAPGPSDRAHPRLYRLYGPAVRCEPDVSDLERLVSLICIRPFKCSAFATGHNGFLTAFKFASKPPHPRARWSIPFASIRGEPDEGRFSDRSVDEPASKTGCIGRE